MNLFTNILKSANNDICYLCNRKLHKSTETFILHLYNNPKQCSNCNLEIGCNVKNKEKLVRIIISNILICYGKGLKYTAFDIFNYKDNLGSYIVKNNLNINISKIKTITDLNNLAHKINKLKTFK